MKQIEFAQVIKSRTSAVIEDGTVFVTEAGDHFVFDRSRPGFERDLRGFLEREAKARTIWQDDVKIWLDWLMDEGTATVSSSTKKVAPKHNVFDWQGYDYSRV